MGQSASSTSKRAPQTYSTAYVEGKEANPSDIKTYDYVIVGGGTAGCVLASRLSEDPNVTVLLLEAGKSHVDYFMTKPPMGWAGLLHTDADWDFKTAPQKSLKNRVLELPRGKLLGGTSSINALVYQHCSPEDFDDWARHGASGWTYDSLRPYFIKAEKCVSQKRGSEARGVDGVWSTSFQERTPLAELIIKAGNSIGIPTSEDFNMPEGNMGVGQFMCSVDEHGHRSSTATAYLTASVLARPNLTVAVGIRAEKILLEATEVPKAYGVVISQGRDSPKFVVKANKEIILSCGVYGSPQLLMISGLGPQEGLKKLNVPVIVNLPSVGKNLKDHVTAGSMVMQCDPKLSQDGVFHSPIMALLNLAKWYFTSRGPFGELVVRCTAVIDTHDPRLVVHNANEDDSTYEPKRADAEILWIPFTIPRGTPPGKKPSGLYALTAGGVLLRPKSTGSLTLKSFSVWDDPIIDPNFYSDPEDLEVAIFTHRLVFKWIRSAALADVVFLKDDETDMTNLLWPANALSQNVSDEQLKEFTLNNAQSAFHACSTARISENPTNGVVNSNLQVHGVVGLRVVDASVFPDIVTGHPAAVVVAVAERAADIIKNARISK